MAVSSQVTNPLKQTFFVLYFQGVVAITTNDVHTEFQITVQIAKTAQLPRKAVQHNQIPYPAGPRQSAPRMHPMVPAMSYSYQILSAICPICVIEGQLGVVLHGPAAGPSSGTKSYWLARFKFLTLLLFTRTRNQPRVKCVRNW